MMRPSTRVDLLFRPIVLASPERMHPQSAWTQHIRFAFWLIDAIRPQTIVELGVQSGVSYCAFCQAVQELSLPAACYGIDTWAGDPHSGPVNREGDGAVLAELRQYHDPRYGGFSTLIESTFAAALSGFGDGSVDLLHIDGYHTYEAVRGDFEAWLPKLSGRAVVLFHDINERRDDFGAWRLWDELKRRYPSFTFLHGHGLGVLAVGAMQAEAILWLTSQRDEDLAAVRDFFVRRAEELRTGADLARAESQRKAEATYRASLEEGIEELRQQLHDGIARYESAVDRAHEVLSSAGRLEGVVEETRRQMATLKAELDASTRMIATLRGYSSRLEKDLADLNARYEEASLDALTFERQLKAFESSTSWRITAPLRMLVRATQRFRLLVRSTRHRLTFSLSTAVGPLGALSESPAWYQAVSERGRLPNRWVLVDCSVPAEIRYLTMFVDPGNGRWHPVALPVRNGRLVKHLTRLPDHVAGLRVKVEGPEQAVSSPPAIAVREIGLLELLGRMSWRRRSRLPQSMRYLLSNGLRASLARLSEGAAQVSAENYQQWIDSYDTISASDRVAIAGHIATLVERPLISIVVPVFNTPERYLRAMIDSVLAQIYPNWELCIADDASTAPHVKATLEEYAARDARVIVTYRQKNGHISAASNSALELATGSHVALLDHDDVLPEHALYMVALAINTHPDADVFYSDEDKIDEQGRRSDPYFKPDWNYELLLGQNYVSHLGVYRRDAIGAVGGFREGFEGSQDYDLLLRIVGKARGPIVHLPWILYHWRVFPGATTFSTTQLDKASEAARAAIKEHLAERGISATVDASAHPYHRTILGDPAIWPKVSVIVPTRDHVDLLRTCVSGLLEKTDYPDLELIIANNDSRSPETLAYFNELSTDARVRVLDCPGAFNYSAINNAAVRTSKGEIVLLLNNDIEIIGAAWLKEMVKHAVRPEIGAVGAKLLYADRTIQHAGVVLGLNGVAGHLQKDLPQDSPGYFGRLLLAHNVSAVTAACLALRRSVFDEAGGFDEVSLKVAFNDVDLCLKITELGYQIIWTPEATLYHLESKSRGSDMSARHFARFRREVDYMRVRWGERLYNDPFFNPNLSLSATYPSLAFPPRQLKPWLRPDRPGL